MGTVNPYFNNLCINIALTTAGAFPTSLVAWDGSAGNAIAFQCIAEDGNTVNVDSTATKYRTNDNKLYAVTQEQEGVTMASLYDRGQLPTTWIRSQKSKQQSGVKILQIFGLGIFDGKNQEQFAIGDLVSKRVLTAGEPANDTYEFNSTPPTSAFVLTTGNMSAIESLLSVTIRATADVTIPTDEQDIIVYTA